jgi:hypothetical protein
VHQTAVPDFGERMHHREPGSLKRFRGPSARFTMVLLIVGLVGCGPAPSNDRWFQVTGGEAPPALHSELATPAPFEPVAFVVAGADGVPFGLVGVGAVFEDGGFVASDVSLCRLHAFDAELRPVASFAGCGDGPAELRAVSGISVAGDTIYVVDGTRRRAVRFLRDGTLLDAPALVFPAAPLGFQRALGYTGGPQHRWTHPRS